MPGRSPAGPLIREHRVIERLIKVLEAELGSIRAHRRADPRMIDQATDFIRVYADRCHHGKEEDILFRRLADTDLEPELAAEMRELIDDHVRARHMTRRLVDANERYASGDQDALGDIEDAVKQLVDLYPVHIAKEDQHFFKASMRRFTDEEQAQMLADFDEFDRGLIHEKYRSVVTTLEGKPQ